MLTFTTCTVVRDGVLGRVRSLWRKKHMQHIDDRVQYAFGKVKTSDVPFSFGYSYRAIFFTLTEDLRLDRFSRELLFPALDSANAPRSATGAVPQFAEGIQFVTSAVVNPGEGVTVLYGINDCETAKMKVRLPWTMSLDARQRGRAE